MCVSQWDSGGILYIDQMDAQLKGVMPRGSRSQICAGHRSCFAWGQPWGLRVACALCC
jgi:hypothetical protein